MPYDLFISYSRRDNERGQVAALAEQIKTAFRAFAGRELSVFFDTRRNPGHGRLAAEDPAQPPRVAPLPRRALAQLPGQSLLPVGMGRLRPLRGHAPVPGRRRRAGLLRHAPGCRRSGDRSGHQAAGSTRSTNARPSTCAPGTTTGEKALQQAHVKETLEKLHASVRERLDRAERARRSPANLMRHNPRFVGRVRELTELRNALTKNKLGVVGARQPEPWWPRCRASAAWARPSWRLAYAHAFAWDYPGGRWQIRCEHVADLRLALLQLAGPMGFEFTDDENKSLALGLRARPPRAEPPRALPAACSTT